MADLRIQFEAQDNARQQVLNLRRNISRVNAEILENNQLVRIGNRETRQLLQTRTAELRLQRQKLSLEREQLSIGGASRGEAVRAAKAEQRERQRALKDALTYRRTQIKEAERAARAEEAAAKRAADTEQRERKQTLNATLTYRRTQIKAAERTARAEEQAAKRSSGAQQAFLTEVASVAREANRALSQFTGSLIKSSSRLETFAATLRVAETDSAAAEQALERLLAVTIELVGIDTADLLGFYSRLRSVGIDADRSISAISGVTKAIAQQGKDAVTTRLVLEQLTQALSSGRIIYQDFRTIFQQLPTFTRIASEALGENIRTIEDFRDVAKSTVGETEAIIRVFEHLDQTSRGADLSTLNAQLEIFRDLYFVTAADAGRGLSDLVIDALKFANSLLESFRLLNPTLKSSIGFIAGAATGLTGLVAVGAIATVTMGALNASLLTLTGATGFAGLAALLAPAAPILLGLGLVAGGVYAVTSAVGEHIDYLNRVKAAEEAFAVSLRETTQALQSNTGIEERVNQYEDYITALERLRAISVTSEVLDVFGSGAGINIADELGFTDLDETIRQYESLVGILSNVQRQSGFTITELRELDSTIANTLTEARRSGNDDIISVLEEAAQKTRELFMSLEQGRSTTPNVFRPITESANQLTAALIELDDQLIRARNATRSATGIDEVADSYMNLRNIAQETGRVQLQQIAQQIRAEGALLRNQELSAEEREEIQEKITDLSFDYRTTKLRIERDITRVETEEAKKRDQIAQQAAANRIAYQARVRRAEVDRLKEFSEEFRNTITAISSQRDRVQFQSTFGGLINQGQGFEEALRNTRNFFEIVEAGETFLSKTQSALSILTGTLNVGFNQAISQSANLLERFTSKSREAIDAQAALNLSITSRQIEAPDAGATSLQSIFDERQGDNNRRINELRQEQLQGEYRLIEQNLNQRFQLYRQVYSRIGNTITGILSGRFESVQEAAQRLFSDLLSFIIRQQITQALSDAREVALNTAKANAKIANEKRVQAEVLRTAYFSQAAEGAGAAAGGFGLGPLGIIAGVLGIGALAYSALNSRNSASSSSSRVSGSRFPSASNVRGGEERPLNVVVEFDDGTARAVNSRIESNERDNRN